MSARDLGRREFGLALGGIVVAFSMAPSAGFGQGRPQLPGTPVDNRRLDSWLRIDPLGTVTIFTGRVELGQGNVTALAQIVAEELDIGLERARMIPVDTTRSPNEGFTAGSNSIEAGGAALRSAAAEARLLLLAKAAEHLSAPPEKLIVKDGNVTVLGGPGSISYWELAAETSLQRETTGSLAPKPASAHTLVGKPAQRLDIPDKVMAAASFVQDLRLPGMVFGRVVRPPSYSAQLASLQDAVVKRMPGVIAVVRDGRLLGVVAEREEQAIAAREALAKAARWSTPSDLPDQTKVHEYLKNLPGIETKTVNEKSASSPASVKTHAATYTKPYLAHASIGPSCAVAGFIDNILTVWSHTQCPYPLRADLAKTTGLPPERIRVIHAQGSGCYGHNGADDAALDAALLSIPVNGRLVKLQL